MKTFFSCLLCLLAGLLSAQTIDHPSFKARSGSIRNITRIERTPECTKVYIHAIFRPKWWISEGASNYLEDTATGKRYKLTGAEGIEIEQKTFMPESGEKDYVLLFEPLPAETTCIHLIDPDDKESNTYDISLVPVKEKDLPPLKRVEGNWFADDAQGHWTYGIYDSVVIMDNRLYTPVECRKKGKHIQLVVQERKEGTLRTLRLTPRKDGSCLIANENGKAIRYVRTRPAQTAPKPDKGFGDNFFRPDSVCLQGYLRGFDPRLGFDSGILYLSDEVTRKDYPTVVPIAPDGTFQCRFLLQHPICQTVVINSLLTIPFYAEPGQTVTLYMDWEDVLTRSRARDRSYPLSNTAYMGDNPDLSRLASTLSNSFVYPYQKLNKEQKTLTPVQFQEQVKPYVARWQQQADSLYRLYAPSAKAVSLIRNQLALKTGMTYLEFQMMRDYMAQQDSTNQALQVQPEDSYYDFLKQMPLNDPSVLASSEANVFLNRFEYMDPLNAAYRIYNKLLNNKSFKALPREEQELKLQWELYEAKDSIADAMCGVRNPLLWQVAEIRSLNFMLPKALKERSIAQRFVEQLQEEITHPYLQTVVQDIFDETHPPVKQSSYQLPEGKATDIFRRIIAPHTGKVLFIDFWATTCGPCRSGIQKTAKLREQYRNHPKFQFVYITSETESPEKAYQTYVEKNLKGEASYRISDTDYKYMRQLFQFNGIPHYILVEKDGSISTEDVNTWNLESFLKRRFGKK